MWPLKSGLWLLERLRACPSEYKVVLCQSEGKLSLRLASARQCGSSVVLDCSVLEILTSGIQWTVSHRARNHQAWALVSVLL